MFIGIIDFFLDFMQTEIMGLFMCFFPLLWMLILINRFRIDFSLREALTACFRALWIFLPLFFGVFLHQSKNVAEISIGKSLNFYTLNFGLLPYAAISFLYIVVFVLFLHRRIPFVSGILIGLFLLTFIGIFRYCYFQNFLNVWQALGQPFLDVMMMTLAAELFAVRSPNKEERKRVPAAAAVLFILAAVAVPVLGTVAEYGFGWSAVAAAVCSFFVFQFICFFKRPFEKYKSSHILS